jgi:hypothetical protein
VYKISFFKPFTTGVLSVGNFTGGETTKMVKPNLILPSYWENTLAQKTITSQMNSGQLWLSMLLQANDYTDLNNGLD